MYRRWKTVVGYVRIPKAGNYSESLPNSTTVVMWARTSAPGEGRPERDGLPQRVRQDGHRAGLEGQRIGDIVVMLRDELWPDE